MKKSITFSASVIALSFSGAAMAQDSGIALDPGVATCATTLGGNCSDIDQNGNNQEATVTQNGTGRSVSDIDQAGTGTTNKAIVEQTADAGAANESKIVQTAGSEGNLAGVTQNGTGNLSNIRQEGDESDVVVDQLGSSNSSDVTQFAGTNDDSTIAINQEGVSNASLVLQLAGESSVTVNQGKNGVSEDVSSGNESFVGQVAEGSSVLIIQDGENNLSDAVQLTGGATITVMQSGSDNQSTVAQAGLLSSVDVNQDGSGNVSLVGQIGLGSVVDVDQTQTSNDSLVGQLSAGSFVKVGQDGSENESAVGQLGVSTGLFATLGEALTGDEGFGEGESSNFTADILQEQSNNSLVVGQLGIDNQVTVQQLGSGNIAGERFTSVGIAQVGELQQATLIQSGNDNTSTIFQGLGDGGTSFNNTADVNQAGDFNESFVRQNGIGNIATVDQYSSNNLSTITQSGDGNTATVTQGSAPSVGS